MSKTIVKSANTPGSTCLLILGLVCVGGCANAESEEADGEFDSFSVDGAADAWGVEEGSPEARAVLRLVNILSQEELDELLDVRAARSIAGFRAGSDRLLFTSDDVQIETLSELDDLAWVGPRAFGKLLNEANRRGWVTSGCVFEPWRLEPADAVPTDRYFGMARAAQAPDGRVHVAYHDDANNDLRVASRDADGTWSDTLVDEQGEVGSWLSLAVGPDETVHVAYIDSTNRDLKYATKESGSSWIVKTLDAQGSVGTRPVIAVDSRGAVHIVYVAWEPEHEVRYALLPINGAWEFQVARRLDNWIGGLDMRVDSEAGVHVAFRERNSVHYTHKPRLGGWSGSTLPTVSLTPTNSTQVSLALDAEGQPHVFHVNRTLYVAALDDTGSWTTIGARDSVEVGAFAATIDRDGTYHVLYSRSGDTLEHLSFVNRQESNSETALSTNWVVAPGTIWIDQKQGLHSVYVASGFHQINYAHRACL